MAERHRSNDGSRDSENFVSDLAQPGQQGRADGNLQRDVATQDEEKRVMETPAGVTRVTGEDKRRHGEDA